MELVLVNSPHRQTGRPNTPPSQRVSPSSHHLQHKLPQLRRKQLDKLRPALVMIGMIRRIVKTALENIRK
jgi:hypothetical protein